jgi:hypothetical protein
MISHLARERASLSNPGYDIKRHGF